MAYRLALLGSLTKTQDTVIRLSNNAFIPFDPDNTDYQQFKIDIANGVELQDADGKPITDVTQFMKGLP
jgi:hypothetical protein